MARGSAGIWHFVLAPLPLAEHTLCMFGSYLARDGLSHQTIKSYLSALPYPRRSRRPFRWKPLPAATVRAPRSQTLTSPQSSGTTHANYSSNSTHTQRPMGSSSVKRQGLCDAVGYLLHGFLRIHEGWRILSDSGVGI